MIKLWLPWVLSRSYVFILFVVSLVSFFFFLPSLSYPLARPNNHSIVIISNYKKGIDFDGESMPLKNEKSLKYVNVCVWKLRGWSCQYVYKYSTNNDSLSTPTPTSLFLSLTVSCLPRYRRWVAAVWLHDRVCRNFASKAMRGNRQAIGWLTGWVAGWLAGCLGRWMHMTSCLGSSVNEWIVAWITNGKAGW